MPPSCVGPACQISHLGHTHHTPPTGVPQDRGPKHLSGCEALGVMVAYPIGEPDGGRFRKPP